MRRVAPVAAVLALLGLGAWLLGRADDGERGAPDAPRTGDATPASLHLTAEGARHDTAPGGAAERPAPPPAKPGHAQVVGRVLRPDGTPAAGAAVRWTTTLVRDVHTLTEAKADADGRFALSLGFVGPFDSLVVASAVGFLFASVAPADLAIGETTDVGDLVLRADPRSLSGRVLGADDRPIGGIVVLEREERQPAEPGWHLLETTSTLGPDGTFAFEGLPPGRYRLRIGAGRSYVREHVEAGTTDLLIRLPDERPVPTFRLRVRVRFADLGMETASPVVFTHTSGWPIETERDGDLWILPVAGTPPFTVLAEYEPTDSRFAPGLLRDAVPREEPYEILLGPGRTLRGRVTAAGRPASAEVVLFYGIPATGEPAVAENPDSAGRPLFPLESRLWTDAEGRFEFHGLPAGRGRLHVEPAPGTNLAAAHPPPVSFDDGAEVLVELEPTVEMRLDLVWPRGEEAPADLSSGTSVQTWGEGSSYADTRVLGFEGDVVRVVVGGLNRGKPVDVLARVGEAWAVARGLVPREDPYVLRLRAAPHVRGRVLDPAGRAVAGAEVNVYLPQDADHPAYASQGAYQRTGADGTFDARPSLPGTYTLSARDAARDLKSRPVLVQTDAPPVDLRLEPIRRLTGRVVGADGEILDRFLVSIVGAGADPSQASSAMCTADGFFELPWPGGERARLVVHAYELPAEERCASREVGPDEADPRLALRPGGVLTGRVLDSAGAGVVARVHARGAWTWRSVASGPDGRFVLRALTEPALDVTVADGDRRLRRHVPIGGPDVELVLPDR